MYLLRISIISLFLLIYSTAVYSQVTEADSLALVALYDSTNGDVWTNNDNWKLDSVSTWFGVTVAGGRVTQLVLFENNLKGTIPPEIGDLTGLTALCLARDSLHGTVPAAIGNLTGLIQLLLYETQLSGSIPTEIGSLSELSVLYLPFNSLQGSIPTEVGNLSKLTYLNLHANQLNGTIPDVLGTLSELGTLDLSENAFTGAIPPALGNLKKLTVLQLGTNQLSDTIPDSLGTLPIITSLGLGINQLSGFIPSALGSLTELTWLDISKNQLDGSVPSTFATSPKLETLLLDNNQLVDLIDLSGNSTLTTLKVYGNKLTFEDIEPNVGISNFGYSPQDSIGTAKADTLIEGNSITLSVSVGGSANKYQWLKDATTLTGDTNSSLIIDNILPEDSGSYTCHITNTIATALTLRSRPAVITVIPLGFIADSLALIDLYDSTAGPGWDTSTNWCTGNPLSTWYGVTVEDWRVTGLELPGNNLTGMLPSSIGDLTQLQILDLSDNNLSGNIPSTISNCTTLVQFDLSTNQFTDSVPSSFSNLLYLELFAIDSNQLSVLPDLSVIDSLDTLAIEYNKFTFEDIEPYISGVSEFTYSPQDSVDTVKSVQYVEGDTLQLTVSVGGAANQYQWMKDGQVCAGDTSDTIKIYGVVPADSGVYTCEITNTLATELTLYSRPVTVTIIPQGFIDDSLALIDLYDSTAGPGWDTSTNWCTGNPLSTWFGVTIEDWRVSAMELSGNNLTGMLPSSIGDLTQIKRVDLSSNNLGGVIPSVLSNCIFLFHLDLSENQFTDSVPSLFGNLTNLEFLAIDSNQLSDLPDLSVIDSLDTLAIQHNKFTFEDIEPSISITQFTYSPQDSIDTVKSVLLIEGDTLQLAVSVGGSANAYQWLKDGQIRAGDTTDTMIIYGVIPADSGKYSCEITNTLATELTLYSRPVTVIIIPQGFIDDSLALIDLYDSTAGPGWDTSTNWCTGNPLSTWYGVTVEDWRVTGLELPGNNLAGILPVSIGDLTALQRLNISSNLVYGEVPVEITNLAEIQYIAFNNNALVDLPDLSLLPLLDILLIHNNKLTFEDIEPNISIPEYIYAPQDSIGEEKDATLFVGDTLRVAVLVGGTANTYQWVKNGETIAGATGSSYIIDSVHFSDSGSYHCEVGNTLAPDLILYSRPIHVCVEMPVNTQLKKNETEYKAYLSIAPNPVNRNTDRVNFYFSLKSPTDITLSVYDPLGNRLYRTLMHNVSGTHSLSWDLRAGGKRIASGSYLVAVSLQDKNGIHGVKRLLAVKGE